MAAMSFSRAIDAPPATVWAMMTDLQNAPARLEAVTRIEMLSEGEFGIGTKWRETRIVMKREATETMEVVAFDPPTSYTVYSDSCGCDFRWTVRVEPQGEGSRLSMDLESKARTFGAKLMAPLGWLMKGMMKKCMDEDLDQLKAAAESSA